MMWTRPLRYPTGHPNISRSMIHHFQWKGFNFSKAYMRNIGLFKEPHPSHLYSAGIVQACWIQTYAPTSQDLSLVQDNNVSIVKLQSVLSQPFRPNRRNIGQLWQKAFPKTCQLLLQGIQRRQWRRGRRIRTITFGVRECSWDVTIILHLHNIMQA